MTRSPTPPRGRVTLHEAAAIAKLSYSEVYRRVTADPPLAPAVQDPETGTWTMARRDALKLKRQPPSKDPRKTVHIRSPRERVERWLAAAGSSPLAGWAAEVLDMAGLPEPELQRWRELAAQEGVSPMEWLRGKLRG